MSQIDKMRVGNSDYDIQVSPNSTFVGTSNDTTDSNVESYTYVEPLVSGETNSSIFTKISNMFKNIRYIYKRIGNTVIDNKSISGNIVDLNNNKADVNHIHSGNDITSGIINSSRLPISSSQINSNEYIPTSSLVYSMNQKIADSAGNEYVLITIKKSEKSYKYGGSSNVFDIYRNGNVYIKKQATLKISLYSHGSSGLSRSFASVKKNDIDILTVNHGGSNSADSADITNFTVLNVNQGDILSLYVLYPEEDRGGSMLLEVIPNITSSGDIITDAELFYIIKNGNLNRSQIISYYEVLNGVVTENDTSTFASYTSTPTFTLKWGSHTSCQVIIDFSDDVTRFKYIILDVIGKTDYPNTGRNFGKMNIQGSKNSSFTSVASVDIGDPYNQIQHIVLPITYDGIFSPYSRLSLSIGNTNGTVMGVSNVYLSTK